MRHEKFNGKMKEFWLVWVKLRSPDDGKIAAEFEAIAILFKYRLEHGASFLVYWQALKWKSTF